MHSQNISVMATQVGPSQRVSIWQSHSQIERVYQLLKFRRVGHQAVIVSHGNIVVKIREVFNIFEILLSETLRKRPP